MSVNVTKKRRNLRRLDLCCCFVFCLLIHFMKTKNSHQKIRPLIRIQCIYHLRKICGKWSALKRSTKKIKLKVVCRGLSNIKSIIIISIFIVKFTFKEILPFDTMKSDEFDWIHVQYQFNQTLVEYFLFQSEKRFSSEQSNQLVETHFSNTTIIQSQIFD